MTQLSNPDSTNTILNLLVGKTIGGHYQVRSLLSHQVERRTFLAQDVRTNQPVVIKLMLFGPDFIWQALKLFEREAATLQTLSHPAIPKYLDSFEIDLSKQTSASGLAKGLALVQTYIPAKSLQALVSAGRRFNEDQLKYIAQSLLKTLQYLHSHHPAVIHRDIKPSNILLKAGNHHQPPQIYLVDFGAVQTVDHGQTRTVVGTYGYMPPEQFGKRALPASDLYSLGASLIYLATGEHPAQLMQHGLQIEFENSTDLSPAFTQWIKRLTNIALSNRTTTADEALSQLMLPALETGDQDSQKNTDLTTKDERSDQPSAVAYVPTRAEFRSQAATKIRGDIRLYITPQEIEIDCLQQRIVAVEIQSPDKLSSIGAIWTAFISVAFICLFITPVPTIFGLGFLFILSTIASDTPLWFWRRPKHKRASIRLLRDRKNALSCELSAPVSPDLTQRSPVIEASEIDPIKVSRTFFRSVTCHSMKKPFIGQLFFDIKPDRVNNYQAFSLRGNESELRWIHHYLQQWSSLEVGYHSSEESH